MAKLLKTSIFFLLAAFLLIAEATHHDHDKDHDKDHDESNDDDSETAVGKINLKLKVPRFRSNGGNSGSGGGSNSASASATSSAGAGAGASGGEGCKCNDAKFKEFMKKLVILYRAYASKELAPELKSILSKMTDFTMNYLAKEKPNEVNKFHNFLQSSAKMTSGAVAQAGGAAFH